MKQSKGRSFSASTYPTFMSIARLKGSLPGKEKVFFRSLGANRFPVLCILSVIASAENVGHLDHLADARRRKEARGTRRKNTADSFAMRNRAEYRRGLGKYATVRAVLTRDSSRRGISTRIATQRNGRGHLRRDACDISETAIFRSSSSSNRFARSVETGAPPLRVRAIDIFFSIPPGS